MMTLYVLIVMFQVKRGTVAEWPKMNEANVLDVRDSRAGLMENDT